ncbi:MAG: hypothetical protein QOD77_1853 [Thermoplasmata archaeon]|jgi:uncharacterized CHY-type Zn-finger protein|nr:hypothetical protein [Thermoplasmata archaeon]
MTVRCACLHWTSPLDLVSFRFACCAPWWPCDLCHQEAAGHPAEPWPSARFHEPSVLCGACGNAMTAPAYVASGSRCPSCAAPFNPGCRPHWPRYFQ